MPSNNLDNLVSTKQLKTEPPDDAEIIGLIRSAKARLIDANKTSLAMDSRFDLAYNAAHSLALSALRMCGYRAKHRYIVFQVIPHTLQLGPEVWRVLAMCHDKRNLAEYEGFMEVDERLLNDLLAAAESLQERIDNLLRPK